MCRQGRNLTNISIHPILFLESPVVQISDCDQLLLVSNYTKCILCNTDTEEFRQIGNQPRDGKFGATFLMADVIQNTKLFCARPGSRFWECNLEGNVLQTHKFKNALKIKNVTNVRSPATINGEQSNKSAKSPSIESLGHLQSILKRFIIGYTDSSFFIFDLKSSAVILWNNEFENIDTIKVVDENHIVLFTRNSEVFTFQMQSLDEIFFELLSEQDFIECARFLLQHIDYFKDKLNDDKFILYLSILKNKLKQIEEAQDLLDEIKNSYDELITDILRERDRKEIERMEMVRSTQLENGVYLVENSYAAVVKKAMSAHQGYSVKVNGGHLEDDRVNQDDDDIVVRKAPGKSKKNIASAAMGSSHRILIEPKPLTEEERIVRGLFLVYKSLRMSSFNMVERYASTFDQYDVAGIDHLLKQLAQMIVENEAGTNYETAQRYCFEMYFNYFNSELIWEIDDASREFIVNGFIAVNTPRPLQVCDKSVQRCELCDFPLAIEMFVLKYKSVGETLIKLLWSRNERRKCFDIVTKVPIVLTIILKLIVNDQLAVDMEHEDRDSVERFIDILFACADKVHLERCIQHNNWFRRHAFWDRFYQRLIRLHADNKILCIDCGQLSYINCNSLGSSKSFYSFDYTLNLCADNMDGLDALRYSSKYSKHIATNALGKEFFLKCLLHS